MDIEHRKEEFSRAYVRAVAAACGFAVAEPSVDDDSVDITLRARGPRGTVRSPMVDAQLKCTAQDVFRETTLALRVKRKNYDDLRATDVMVPRILIVVVVPEALDAWLEATEDALVLRRCGYWVSMRGAVAIEDDSRTVSIPRSQVFDRAALGDMMDRIGAGGLP